MFIPHKHTTTNKMFASIKLANNTEMPLWSERILVQIQFGHECEVFTRNTHRWHDPLRNLIDHLLLEDTLLNIHFLFSINEI
jgi:hypothetical protein